MIKITKLGEWEDIHNYTGKLLDSFGYKLEIIEDATAKNYMLKNVIAMGYISIDLLKEVLPKVRNLIYIGDKIEVKEVIKEFCIEKDIPEAMSKSTFTSEIVIYRNNSKIYQIYDSNIFSEMELASKFLTYNGSKIMTLVKYVTQVQLQRDTALFDADLNEIKGMHRAFVDYYTECDLEGTKFDPERLLEIYETHKP